MLKPIVVGVDGSQESSAAASWAAREALRRHRPLRLVHAWEGAPADGTEVTLPELNVPHRRARSALRTITEQLRATHGQLDVFSEQIALPPGPALLREAESAELLVLGSQGFGSVSGAFAGSVALATAAHAPCPLVLVRAGCTGDAERLPGATATGTRAPFRDIALAVDPCQPCDPVVEFAFRASDMRGAPLRCVHTWHVALRHGLVGPDERAVARNQAERNLAAALRPWKSKFPQVVVHEIVIEGHPAHQVVKAAGGAGLLVVGRRVRRAALGSHAGPVTHAAIHHVSCPVAVVPHD